MKDIRPHYTQAVTSISAEDCACLIGLALEEDAPDGDPSSEAISQADQEGRAKILANEGGMLCGLSILPILFQVEKERSGQLIKFNSKFKDGQVIEKGDIVLSLTGNIRKILSLERVILNFLQYLSGISSQVDRVVKSVGTNLVILDTRKTIPGFRRLSKYAVYCGGGTNHRIHLSDMLMIKDNHIALAGGIRQAVDAVRQHSPGLKIEVEIENLKQFKEALALGVDIILFDNMSVSDIHSAKLAYEKMSAVQGKKIKKPFFEISGNWTPDRVVTIKNENLGKIGLSMGALTHSTRFLDFSLELEI